MARHAFCRAVAWNTPSGAWFGAGPNALTQLTEQAVDQDGQGFTSVGEWNDMGRTCREMGSARRERRPCAAHHCVGRGPSGRGGERGVLGCGGRGGEWARGSGRTGMD